MDQLAQWWSTHPWTFIAIVAAIVAIGKSGELSRTIRESFEDYRNGGHHGR